MHFYDKVFSANARNASIGYQSLAEWLTIEQLEKLAAKNNK
jgi:hypothetical protein